MTGSRFGALALASSLLVVSCGGSDEQARPSRQEFLKQANAVCNAFNEGDGQKTQQLLAEANIDENSRPDEVAAVLLNGVLPLLQGEIDDLQALRLPSEGGLDYQQLFNDFDDAIAETERQLQDDPVEFLGSGEDPFADLLQQLGALGLTNCNAEA